MLAGAVCVVGAFVLRMMKYTELEEVYPGIAVGLLVFLLAHLLLPRRAGEDLPSRP
jgi:hypothetical protein